MANTLNAPLDSLEFSMPPWEALITQIATPTPLFWRHYSNNTAAELDLTLPQLVLANGIETRFCTKRNLRAYHGWRGIAADSVDIVAVRKLAVALSEMGNAQIRLRSNDQGANIAFYQAPKAASFPKLLYAFDRAIAHHPPLLRSLLHGLIMFAIHPLADGNGRGARMYWVNGLHSAGFSANEIAHALLTFYGASRIASHGSISCASSGGTSLPFIKRWHQILTALRPSAI